MHCTNNINQIITSWGPFIAALITGMIAVIVVNIQSKATLKAAKTQSDATIEAMTRSVLSQTKMKKFETLQIALADFLTQMYLIERGAASLQNPESIFKSIGKLQSTLGINERENNIRNLLTQLKNDFINQGHVGRVGYFRQQIENEATHLISELGI